jgi:hypothetical protein
VFAEPYAHGLACLKQMLYTEATALDGN